MHTNELDYELPRELIAQHPVVPRDRSRLLVHDRRRKTISHRALPDLLGYLNPADIIVYNDTRVLRARLRARKPTGGAVELLFLRRTGQRLWEVLARPSARLSEGLELRLADTEGLEPDSKTLSFRLRRELGEGRWLLKNESGTDTEEILEAAGEMPLPPYIHEPLSSPEEYQTVYAHSPGSAAAPTAGLHFTPELLERIRGAGVRMAPLTLHVGLDTFRPVNEPELELHQIHREEYSIPRETYEAVLEAKDNGGKVLAVGTTTVRVLETVFASEPQPGGENDRPETRDLARALPQERLTGESGLFITPGFQFSIVDKLLTNFHLPRSTLLALVMAFAGIDEVRGIYREAVRERYRFYSFGDAMLLI